MNWLIVPLYSEIPNIGWNGILAVAVAVVIAFLLNMRNRGDPPP